MLLVGTELNGIAPRSRKNFLMKVVLRTGSQVDRPCHRNTDHNCVKSSKKKDSLRNCFGTNLSMLKYQQTESQTRLLRNGAGEAILYTAEEDVYSHAGTTIWVY